MVNNIVNVRESLEVFNPQIYSLSISQRRFDDIFLILTKFEVRSIEFLDAQIRRSKHTKKSPGKKFLVKLYFFLLNMHIIISILWFRIKNKLLEVPKTQIEFSIFVISEEIFMQEKYQEKKSKGIKFFFWLIDMKMMMIIIQVLKWIRW